MSGTATPEVSLPPSRYEVNPARVAVAAKPTPKRSSIFAWIFVSLAAANCIAQIAWFWRYTAHNINFDAISYIGIAHHLLDGNWRASLNGYWSPLLSWCIALLGLFTNNLLLAARLVTIASFVACMPLMFVLSLQLWRSMTVAAFSVLCFTLARGIVASSVYFIGADFLLTAFVLAYFILLLRCLRNPRLHNWIALGGAHGLAFLAKAFAMPWLTVSTLLAAMLVNRRKPSRAIITIIAAMSLPLFLWSSWGALLKTRYGHFTAGYQSTWNLLPNETKAAADRGALSFLRDKSRSTDEYLVVDNMYASSPLWNAHIQLRSVAGQILSKEKTNLPEALKQLLILLTPGGILALALSFHRQIGSARSPEKLWSLLTLCAAAALIISYCMLVFDARYLLPLVPLLFVLAAEFLLSNASPAQNKLLRLLPAALLVLGLLYGNLYHASPFRNLRRDSQTDVYALAASLRQHACDRLITVGSGRDPQHGVGWEAGIYAAYFAQCRLVGFSDRLPSSRNVGSLASDAETLHASSMLLIDNADMESTDAVVLAVKPVFPHIASVRDTGGHQIGVLLSR